MQKVGCGATIATVFCLLGLLMTATEAGSPPAKKELAGAEECKVGLHIMRGDSPWKGYTRSAEEEKTGKHVVSATIATSYERPGHLEKYDISKEPLLAIDRENQRVIVNSKYFSDLDRPDAPRLSKGSTAVIGTFKDLTFKNISPGKLVLFLLESQIIETYWHIESRLCLQSEEDTESLYIARFMGVHIYYTNQRNEDPFSCVITVNKKTGVMTLSNE